MKRTIQSFWIMMILFLLLFPMKSLAWGMDEVQEEAEKVFQEWLNQYTAKTASEEERLKIYYLTNCSCFSTYEAFQAGGDIVVKMGALVYPVSENSKWAQYEKHEYENPKDGIGYYVPDYYMRMSKVDGEYKIVYMDFVPEGYDEYVQKMKEKGIDVENLDLKEILTQEAEEKTEVIEQNAETQNLTAENKIVEKTSLGITLVCGVIIIGCFIYLARKCIRRK